MTPSQLASIIHEFLNSETGKQQVKDSGSQQNGILAVVYDSHGAAAEFRVFIGEKTFTIVVKREH